ncbi:hypothetical protein BCR34DRAFT_305607 [Clohesyomyces aquaticus]|uniref:Uncharacterized protein n=1 Tax=Clohesyomyces aquaticus TaxID=1231657 RepID=A0A1Y1ZPQ2_9PLEO|nr:hypothetical protein BCR34DRAFT_305607 [Clohesyomyces aquaticus]
MHWSPSSPPGWPLKYREQKFISRRLLQTMTALDDVVAKSAVRLFKGVHKRRGIISILFRLFKVLLSHGIGIGNFFFLFVYIWWEWIITLQGVS